MISGSGVWLQPDTRVVIMGGIGDVNTLLMVTGLRNTRHAIYVTTRASSVARLTRGKPSDGMCSADSNFLRPLVD